VISREPTGESAEIAGKRGKVIADLEATQRAFYDLHGMVAVLQNCDETRLSDGQLECFAEAMETVMSPVYEAIEHGIEQLRADAEKPDDDAATVADVAFDRFQIRCEKMPLDQVALELRAHQWEAAEILSANLEEDGYSVHKTFTRSGLKHFLAEREFLQSLLPQE
jgi:hypothetical protein